MKACAVVKVICAGFLLWIASAFPASSASATRNVVLLFDERPDLPGLAVLEAEFLHAIASGSADPVEVYSEAMDLSRFGFDAYQPLLRDFLRAKFADKKIDAVVAVMSPALDFLLSHGDAVFPGVPIVFCGIDRIEIGERSLPLHVRGILVKREFAPTLELALKLHPATRHIVVVAGTSEFDARVLQKAREEFRSHENQLSFTYLTALPLQKLLTELANLPPDTIVLYTTLFKDGAGQPFVPHEVLQRVSAAASAPTYGFLDQYLGRGIVGGVLYSLADHGAEAAKLTLRILAGSEPPGPSFSEVESRKVLFDWRQMQRWGISAGRLPPQSEVRFRNPTVWQQYRGPILAIGYAHLAQAALIAWLLYERRHRLRSEAEAHDLSGRLIKAGEEERARLARELHDDVTQRLALLAIAAGREERGSPGSDTGPAMRTMRDGLARLSEDVHALSYRLHPSILNDLGLIEALKVECERFSRTCPTRLDVDPRDVPGHLPQDVALCLFRIAQEGLRNVARHAGAKAAEVSIRYRNGGLQLSVRDDGIGFDASRNRARASLGHASMRQRALALGGKVEIDSTPGLGTVVRAWVPVKEERREPSARAAG